MGSVNSHLRRPPETDEASVDPDIERGFPYYGLGELRHPWWPCWSQSGVACRWRGICHRSPNCHESFEAEGLAESRFARRLALTGPESFATIRYRQFKSS